jgi:hypothetical protein
MPRPNDASDLIRFEAGAEDFRVGDWWSTFKEARLFLPRGFAAAMKTLGLHTVDPLNEFATDAVQAINGTGWKEQLPSKHWNDSAPTQFKSAAGEHPMLLPKIAIAIEALNLYAQRKWANPKNEVFDGYAVIDFFAAGYWADGWTEEVYGEAKETDAYKKLIKSLRAMSQTHPDIVLHDVAAGKHATHGICTLISAAFPDRELIVRPAQRFPRRGVAPASDMLRPYPD